MKEKLHRRRMRQIRERQLLNREKPQKPVEDITLRLRDKSPMPPRNGPCPLHPEHKFKKCPHGCREYFEHMRAQSAGDVIIRPVEKGHERAGKTYVAASATLDAVKMLSVLRERDAPTQTD